MDTDSTDHGTVHTPGPDPSGRLDEALERLHRSGPEREGWLSNHAPMAVEALARHGQAQGVHRWIDRYQDKLEDMPGGFEPVTDANWRQALGDPRRLTDWIGCFTRQLAEHPWRAVLADWWPRLLPGISGAATHPVIRVGHAVRTLLDEAASPGAPGTGPSAAQSAGPRLAELAHALGYWAARHATLTGIAALPSPGSAAAGLAAVPRIGDQSGGIRERLARITALPALPALPHPGAEGPGTGPSPEAARELLTELVRAATHRYATHAHGAPVMLVHAATAPNAVLRTLPALPRELWLPGVEAAWSASAAVTAAYAPVSGLPEPAVRVRAGAGQEAETAAGTAESEAHEVFQRAAAHGDEHAIKLTDTALDVAGWERDGTLDSEPDPGAGLALAAARQAVELIEPLR